VEQLGGLDAGFLYCETPGMHMHVCGLLVLDPSTMAGEPYHRIRSMLLDAVPQVALMRKRLATVPLGIARPFWVDDMDFDIDCHLHRVHLGPPGDDRSLADVVGDVASKPLPRDRPLWEVWFIEGLAEGRVALLAKMHHATVDGIEGVAVMGRLFDVRVSEPAATGRVAPGPGGDWQPQHPPGRLELLRRGLSGRFGDSLEVARLLPATAGRLAATLWQARTRRDSGPGAVRPFSAPRTSFNATLTPRRSIAFTDVALADVKMVKDAFGVKVNDVVTAVVGGALRRYLADRDELPERPLIAAEPVSVHGRTGALRGVTKLSVIFSTLGTDVEDPVERLRAVAAANVRAKEMSQAMGADTFTRWAGQAWPNALSLAARMYSGLRVANHHSVVFNLVLSNVAGPPVTLYLAGAPVEGTYAFGPITDGAGLNLTVISSADRVGVGIVACTDLTTDVWDLAAAIPGALDELMAAVGLNRAG
jgi:diacylglycerol O-acyltransferase / wax synthase